MAMAAPTRTSPVYNMLVLLLVAGLAAGAGLLFLTTSGPARAAELTLDPAESVGCPSGSGAPVCYNFDLVNTGTEGAFVRCEVTASGDTTAEFGNGQSSYEGATPLEAGKGWHLLVRVEAGADDVVTEPIVGCGEVS